METDLKDFIGKTAIEAGVDKLTKEQALLYRIDDEGVIRLKKQMLTDAELKMMDAKAFLLYVIEQYEKNSKSEDRIAKLNKGKEFILENMPEQTLPFNGVVPTVGEDEKGWYVMATVNGFEMKNSGHASEKIAVTEWNKSVRLMS